MGLSFLLHDFGNKDRHASQLVLKSLLKDSKCISRMTQTCAVYFLLLRLIQLAFPYQISVAFQHSATCECRL